MDASSRCKRKEKKFTYPFFLYIESSGCSSNQMFLKSSKKSQRQLCTLSFCFLFIFLYTLLCTAVSSIEWGKYAFWVPTVVP